MKRQTKKRTHVAGSTIDSGAIAEQTASLVQWVDENSHNFEFIYHDADKGWKEMLDGSETVRKFIAETGGILYGGTAIDLALRLVGEQIYPDDDAPDLDFYANDNVEAAYTLADIFYNAGYETARAINARHVKTMKVAMSGGVFVADISFCPAKVFSEIPYLMSAGPVSTKIVHPVFQRVDMHSALAIPYDGAPMEVIFHRWQKDLGRFNKLAAAYPVDSIKKEWFTTTELAPLTKVGVKTSALPLCGWAALACITSTWINECPGADPAVLRIAKPAALTDDGVSVLSARGCAEYITDEPIAGAVHYEPYFTHSHGRFERNEKGVPTVWWHPEGRLITIANANVGGRQILCASAQFNLYYFLGLFFQYHIDNPPLAAAHLAAYEDLLFMTNFPDLPECLRLSAKVYGRHNETLGEKISINRMMHDIEGVPLFTTPVNYYPARSINNPNGHPKFDPETSFIFRELGRKIDA